MQPYCEEDGLFYMSAKTEWLPAEHFMDINNWDDSLKPSASYYIKQVEEWIASKEKCAEENESRNVANEDQEIDATKSVIITEPTPNSDVDESSHSKRYSVGVAKSFACTICGKKLASKKTLNHHLLIHSGEKPFVCSQCGRSFARKYDLIRHNRVHSGEKPFACSECGKAFGHKIDLTRHYRIHSGEKPYACIQCGKAFAQKIDLTRHFRLHSGEKPFSCEKCGNSFIHSSSRKNHIKQCKVSDTVV